MRLVLCSFALALLCIPAHPAEAARKKTKRLKAFSSCTSLVGYARHHGLRTLDRQFGGGPRPFPAPAPVQGGGDESAGGGSDTPTAAPAPAPTTGDRGGGGTDFSTTNVQEEGVDEPDVIKTDGEHIYAIAYDQLHVIDARADEPKILGSLRLEGYGHQLLLHGTKLLVIGGSYEGANGYYGGTTLIREVSVSDPAAPRVLRELRTDGDHVSSRLTGSTARVVISAPPRAFQIPSAGGPETYEQYLARRRARVASARSSAWLPRATLKLRTGERRTRSLVSCRRVRRPASFSGLETLTVLTIDIEKGLPAVDSDALMTSGETVYGSPRSLYVATQRFNDQFATPSDPPGRTFTAIHKFDVSDPGRTDYVASGEVPGYLLSQWSLSEHEGVLRAATTTAPPWWGPSQGEQSESHVTTLRAIGGRLAALGRVSGLGKGERIYAVRMIGDVGYVVTFRQTDPLYTIDLHNAAEPKVLGELKILGYSAYLHPVGEGLLLGVGQDATEQGRRQGAQLSLFDVSDLRNPTRLHQRTLGPWSSTEAEYDHHAFLYWPGTQLAVIPVTAYGDKEPFSGAIGFRIDKASGITEVGRVQHDDPAKPGGYVPGVERSMVLGDRLVTLSARGLMTSTLDTLVRRTFLPFPGAPDFDCCYDGPAPPPSPPPAAP